MPNTPPILTGESVEFVGGAKINTVGSNLMLDPGPGGTIGTGGLVTYTGTVVAGGKTWVFANGLLVNVY